MDLTQDATHIVVFVTSIHLCRNGKADIFMHFQTQLDFSDECYKGRNKVDSIFRVDYWHTYANKGCWHYIFTNYA